MFTSCRNSWIIVLERTLDTCTNEKRTKIVNRRFAKFRGSEFMVKDIIHKFSPLQTINNIIDVNNNKYEIGKKCRWLGYIFFTTFVPAYRCHIKKLTNGIHMKWSDDGSMLSYINYIQGN